MKKKVFQPVVFDIYKSYGLLSEDDIKEIKQGLSEANEIPLEEVPDDWVIRDAYYTLDDERANLNVQINGVIVGFVEMGLWNGKAKGLRVLGNNLSDILATFCDDAHWYADKYNVRGKMLHHDGTNYVLYRYIDNIKQAENLKYLIRQNLIDEQGFMKRTKSIRPFVAKVYGWRNYGKQACKKVG